MEGRALLAQSQPQPRASLGPGAGLVHHVEGLCDLVQLLLRDAPALVRHRDAVARLCPLPVQGHHRVRLGGLAGVVQQILQQGLEQGGVPGQGGLLRLDHQVQVLGRHGGQGAAPCLLAQKAHVHALHLRPGVAHHQQAHEGQGQVLQPLALGEDIAGGLEAPVLVQGAGAEHVRVADDGGEGGLQLVDKAAGEVLLPPGRVLQLLDVFGNGAGHAVEAGGQLADLVVPGHLGPGGVVPLGQLGGHPAQGADGGGQPVGEGENQRRADPHHQQGHPAVDLVVDLPVGEEGGDVPDGLHVQGPVGQGYGPGAVDQMAAGALVKAEDVA